jgi:hypothetical protein
VPPNTETGRRGEFLAAYILESHGIECHHVNREGADLWCKVQGRVFTVEALDRQLVIMRPTALITSGTTRISIAEFNEANQRRTIEELINP